METVETRCCIAGGGPSGIMLGYLLARSRIDVVVLEKWADFFRDFRGDTIHPSTMDVLYELGLLEDFLKLPHTETRRLAGYIGGEEIVLADFGRLRARCPYIAFVPQWDFLKFLAEKAKAYPGFHLMMETQATDLIHEGGHVAGVLAKTKQNTLAIRAELVIGADGRHSTIREKARLPIADLGAPIDVLWFRLPRQDDGAKQSFGYVDDGKFLVLLDRGDYWQCAYVIRKGAFDAIKPRGLDAFRNDIATVAPFLRPAVEELQDWEHVKLLSVNVDRLTAWYGPRLLCIGDAAHAMSPVGGVGINLAIQDAVAAANVLVPAFGNGTPSVADLAKIQKRRTLPTRLTQGLQVFVHRHVLTAILGRKGRVRVPWFIRLFGRVPPLRWIPARVVGIGFRPEHVRFKLSDL